MGIYKKRSKNETGQEKRKENTLSTKKIRIKRKRYRSRKKKEGNGKRKFELNIKPHFLDIFNLDIL